MHKNSLLASPSSSVFVQSVNRAPGSGWHVRAQVEAPAAYPFPGRPSELSPRGTSGDSSEGALGLSNCHISTYRPKWRQEATCWAGELEETAARDHREWIRETEKKLRHQDEDSHEAAAVARDKKRRITFHPQGSLIVLDKLPGFELYERENESVRGKVEGFSTKSRIRMLAVVSALKITVLPLFVTLTYPAIWDPNPEVWKAHLNAFGMWLKRAYPGSSFIWKLEPQERGAPHFHLLVYGVPFLPWVRLSRRWAEIVSGLEFTPGAPEGSESSWKTDALEREVYLRSALGRRANSCDSWEPLPDGVKDHFRAGCEVDRAKSHRGVLSYVSKKYMGKECSFPASVPYVGRFWGVIGRQYLPSSVVVVEELSIEAFYKLRRIFRKLAKSRGFNRRGGGAITLYTQAHLQWARALDFCEGEPIERLTLFACITDAQIASQVKAFKDWQPF